MRKSLIRTTLAISLAVTASASLAAGKTLVFCSEGSPGGFNPSLHSAGTDFDASAQPIYNRLTEFEPGTTKVVPGLAESWSVSAEGT